MTKRTRSNTQETIDPVQDQVDHVVDTIQVSILQRSATLLEESIQNSRSSAVIARRRIQETYSPSTSPSVKKNKKQSEFLVAEHFLEKDRILTSESELSVGTRIKRACLKLYGKYDSLDKQEKTLVELGANSILDLTKHNSSHKKMFTNLEWKYLIKEFTSNFQDYELDADIEAKVSEIDKKARIELGPARALANKYENMHKGISSTFFDFYSEYLKVLQFRRKVFRKDLDVTEGDLTVKIWAPLLETIMRNEDDVRLKWGDSVGDSVDATDHSRGFKVDVRVVRDNFKQKETDSGNVELSRLDASVSKIISDRVKVLIESKCVVDRLLYEGKLSSSIVVPALQLSGLRARLYSVRIAADGLYVAVDEGSSILPTTVTEIQSLRKTFCLLEKFKKAAIHIADLSLQHEETRKSSAKNRRATWIPPRGNARISPLPKYLLSSIH